MKHVIAALLLVVAMGVALAGAEEKVVIPVGRPSASYPQFRLVDVWLEGVHPAGMTSTGNIGQPRISGAASGLFLAPLTDFMLRDITIGGVYGIANGMLMMYQDGEFKPRNTGEARKERALVEAVVHHIYDFAFPELGDSTTFAFGTCVCGHSLASNLPVPGYTDLRKMAVRGGCKDAMICSVLRSEGRIMDQGQVIDSEEIVRPSATAGPQAEGER